MDDLILQVIARLKNPFGFGIVLLLALFAIMLWARNRTRISGEDDLSAMRMRHSEKSVAQRALSAPDAPHSRGPRAAGNASDLRFSRRTPTSSAHGASDPARARISNGGSPTIREAAQLKAEIAAGHIRNALNPERGADLHRREAANSAQPEIPRTTFDPKHGIGLEVDEVDPLDGVDFYIKFGHYEKAADILRWYVDSKGANDLNALRKLLHVYFQLGQAHHYAPVLERMVATNKARLGRDTLETRVETDLSIAPSDIDAPALDDAALPDAPDPEKENFWPPLQMNDASVSGNSWNRVLASLKAYDFYDEWHQDQDFVSSALQELQQQIEFPELIDDIPASESNIVQKKGKSIDEDDPQAFVPQPPEPIKDVEVLKRVLDLRFNQPIPRIGELLLADGVINRKQFENALLRQQQYGATKPRFGEILVSSGAVKQNTLDSVLARRLGVPLVDLRHLKISPPAVSVIPRFLSSRYVLMPCLIHSNQIVVAMQNPMDQNALNALRFACERHILTVMAPREDIEWAISQHYKELRKHPRAPSRRT